MGACVLGIFCFASSFLLLFGIVFSSFGFGSPFWGLTNDGKHVHNLWNMCDLRGHNCTVLPDEDDIVYASRGLIVVGIIFAFVTAVAAMYKCWCYPGAEGYVNRVLLILMVIFQTIAGILVMAGLAWWGYYQFEDQEDMQSNSRYKYGYFLNGLGALCLLVGALITALGICCEREVDTDR